MNKVKSISKSNFHFILYLWSIWRIIDKDLEFFIVLSFEFCCSARVKMYKKKPIFQIFFCFSFSKKVMVTNSVLLLLYDFIRLWNWREINFTWSRVEKLAFKIQGKSWNIRNSMSFITYLFHPKTENVFKWFHMQEWDVSCQLRVDPWPRQSAASDLRPRIQAQGLFLTTRW